jgi:hypothetical protein
MASQYATPGGVDPAAVMAGIVANRNNSPSHYATPGGVDPGAVMRGIVEQFALQQAAQQLAPVPPTGGVTGTKPNYNGSIYWNPQSGLPDPLTTMVNIVKNRQGYRAPPPPQIPLWALGGAQPGGGHGPMAPPAPYYQPPKLFPTGPQGPPRPAAGNPWTPIAGLGRRMADGGGLGRRRRYADGGELGPDGLSIPTPENNWGGAGAPSPGQIGYDEAMAGNIHVMDEALRDDPARYSLGPPYRPIGDYVGGEPLAPPSYYGGDGGSGGVSIEVAPEGALDFTGGGGPGAPPANWEDFKNGDTTTGGGFFTIEDLYNSRQEPVPSEFKSGSQMPSTNNYRLFGGTPNHIMRNGRIINMSSPTMWGPAGEAYSMDWYGGRWRGGGGAGFPAAYAAGSVAPNIVGWPGQLDNWGQSSTAGM